MDDESLNSMAQLVRRRRSVNNPEQHANRRLENGEASRAVTIEDIVRTIAGIAQQQAQTNKFAEFRKLAPPYFDGKSNPLEAERWICKLEKFFEVLNCDEAERVQFAVFQLEGNADSWWEMEKLTYGNDISTLSWEMFKEAFYNNYFPKSLWQEKEMEFMNLKQGIMSIAEYLARFVELAKFGQVWIRNEITKARMFEMGLSPHIRQFIVPFQLNSFTEMVEKARLVERELSVTRKIEEKSSRKRNYQNFVERSRNSFRSKRPFNSDSTTQVSRSITSQNQYGQCSHCFKNHRTEDCRWLTGACVACGQHGHKRVNCPQFRRPFAPPNAREIRSLVNQRSMPNQNRKMGQTQGDQGRVFSSMNTEQARASNAVVSGGESSNNLSAESSTNNGWV